MTVHLKNPINQSAWETALVDAGKVVRGAPAYHNIKTNEWEKYLTLLNLRTCEIIGGKLRTEQVYVHSKLLIVDDRHILMGSANINDRSLSGKRDSEIAVVLFDNAQERKTMGDKNTHDNVLALKLRVDLWKKHFALPKTGNSVLESAQELQPLLEKPAAENSVAAIQRIAKKTR